MPIIRAPGAARRSAVVKTETAAAKQEKQQVKALRTDLQAIVDGIDANTNQAQLRTYVKDLARIVFRLVRLVD